VTTINAAATIRVRKLGAVAAFVALGCFATVGCSSTGNLLEANNTQPNLAPTGSLPSPTQATSRVAIAPIIGAPESVAAQLASTLTSQLKSKNVTVAATSDAASDYTIRPYMVAARERAGTKVSYIWDVTNPKGERVNRITGEEVVTGSNSRDPWVAVSPAIIGEIASKTATSLGAWLPSQRPAQPAPTSATTPGTAPTPIPVAARPLPTAPGGTSVAAAPTAIATNANRTTTGSIPRPGLTLSAVRPKVTGAPGDGSVFLARALAAELGKNGVALTLSQTGQAFKVDGKVAMGPPKSGKQAIQIDWIVRDAKGSQLGTVSQKNDIPAGSLNGAWGRTASAAAGAAAQGILRLMREQQKKTN